MIRKTATQSGELNGFLDRGSRMEGELRFETTFRIDGKFVGKIVSDGDLIIGEGGEIEAEVHAGKIFISGTAKGEIFAQDRVHLAPNGKVFADLVTPTLIIEEGAVFEGRCSMSREPKTGTEGGSVPKLVKTLPAKESAGS